MLALRHANLCSHKSNKWQEIRWANNSYPKKSLAKAYLEKHPEKQQHAYLPRHPEIRQRELANKGKKRSAETRARLSVSHKGIPFPESGKKKLSAIYKGRRLPDLAYVNGRKACTKTYRLISPKGEEMVVSNMRKHCQEYKLSPSKMSNVVTGKCPHHRGWQGTIIPSLADAS